MNKVKLLREQYPVFRYKNYNYKVSKKNLEIFFRFETPPEFNFQSKVVIKNINHSRFKKIKKNVIENLIFHLGLIEAISYWKATCSPLFEIEAGKITKDQLKWFKNLVIDGMGQFFYENSINWRSSNFLRITSANDVKMSFSPFSKKLRREIMVPVGGGKDSAVTLELLSELSLPLSCFSLNPTKNAEKIMEISSCKKYIIVERKIDNKLLELNRMSFLNGHTPFSAYLAFLTVLVGVLFDKKFIALSNERSSNEGNLKHMGKEINHQYSKSFDFEKKFKKYSRKYLAQDVYYFSFLRPLYEIQVAKIFVRYEKYFSAFLSCNEAYKTKSGIKEPTGQWCQECAKCLFIFAALYPFLEKETMVKIFGKNLFENKKLLSLMKHLIGVKKEKPFECVGTRKESLTAFYLSWKKANRVGENPALLDYFEQKIIPRELRKGFVKGLSQYPQMDKQSKDLLACWNKKHNVPKNLVKLLEKKITLDKSQNLF